MKIDILTLFPSMFTGPFDESLIKRALKNKLVDIKIHNLRDWADDKHHTVDDTPYGGGAGMVLKVDVLDKALSTLKSKLKNKKSKVILLSPQGKTFNQKMAGRLAKLKQLVLICGHYEGFDERIKEHLIDKEISIGDYVLTGGELPAMVVVDIVVRLIPGVVGKKESVEHESFSKIQGYPPEAGRQDTIDQTLLDYPTYTKPEIYKGWKVPEVLLSGDHKKVDEWRAKMSLKNTKKKRPDLLN